MPTAPRTRTLRAEVRTLGSHESLLTTPTGASFRVDIDAATLLRMLDAWHTGEASGALTDGWEASAELLFSVLVRDQSADDEHPRNTLSDRTPDFDTGDGSDAHAGDLLVMGDAGVVAALQQIPTQRGVRAVPDHDWQRVIHRAFRTGELLVFVVRGGDDATLIAFDRLCADSRTPWVAVEVTRSTVWLGPFVTPGVGASYEDFADRRTAAAFDAVAHRALRTPAVGGDCGLAPHLLEASLKEALSLLTKGGAGDIVYEISTDATTRPHPVLPLPHRVISESRPHTVDDLVDSVTGLVQRTRDVTHHPSIPRALATAQSDVCNMRRVSRWANNTSCQGAAFNDPAQARASAVGEAVERYCGNLLDTLPVTYASYDTLQRGPVRALDPDELVLYSDDQYATPGFPFVRMTPQLDVHWVPGRSLTTGEDVLVPASMVYVNWFTAGYSAAPVTNFCPFAGIAAGPTLDYAITSALEEIIERHATMVWWLNAHPFDATDPGELAALWSDVDPVHGQRPSLIMLDNEFGVPVAAGVLHNDRDRLVNVGFACRHTPEAAALKAWTEACTLQEGSRDLLRADGAHWDAMSRGELNSRSFKPWRGDRRYLDSYRGDMRD
ncbi:MAG: YcaO-like family protein, partial [Microcella sp.]